MQANAKQTPEKLELANHFNTFFCSVFSNSSDSSHNCAVPQFSDVNFISEQGVLNMLLNLKPKCPSGPGNVPNLFLRRYAVTLSEFLLIIFRTSLLLSELPSDWRTTRIAPIHKKGDRLLVENYHPIALTSSCCKLIEHIIA